MNEVSLHHVVQRHPDLLFAYMGDEVVMMSDDQNDYIGLNPVASKIWEILEQPKSVVDLCADLQEQFEVTAEQCRQDVLVFLNDMQQRGLIRTKAE